MAWGILTKFYTIFYSTPELGERIAFWSFEGGRFKVKVKVATW